MILVPRHSVAATPVPARLPDRRRARPGPTSSRSSRTAGWTEQALRATFATIGTGARGALARSTEWRSADRDAAPHGHADGRAPRRRRAAGQRPRTARSATGRARVEPSVPGGDPDASGDRSAPPGVPRRASAAAPSQLWSSERDRRSRRRVDHGLLPAVSNRAPTSCCRAAARPSPACAARTCSTSSISCR